MPKPPSLDALRKNREFGEQNSRAVRIQNGENLLWKISGHLRTLGRNGDISTETLRELAQELNERGVRTNRGNLLDEQKLHAAFRTMGINKTAILAWRFQAENKAIEFGVPVTWMVWQLWQDWLYHLKVGLLRKGTMSVVRHPFEPTFVHPREWLEPSKLDPDTALIMMGTPAVARACYPLFKVFDPHGDDKPHGDVFDQDEDLSGHPVLRAKREISQNSQD